jgi:putative transposase
MPAKNTIKIYVPDGIYHLYNRGVEKRVIFTDDYDYKVFINCLKEALLSPSQLPKTTINFTLKGETFQGMAKAVKNFHDKIQLLAYCLMPNHFHLLVKQTDDHDIDAFMRSIGTRYSIHFNKRHKRVGTLFQGPYKASLIEEDVYLLHLSRYIHRNPLPFMKDVRNWHYSSYGEYIGKRKTSWINTQVILEYFKPAVLSAFKDVQSYRQFVEYDLPNLEDSIMSFLLD